MFQIDAEILENKKIAKEHYKLIISSKKIAKKAKPGQFVQIKIEKVFLRRPFSIHRVGEKEAEIIYKIVGRGTEILSNIKKEEKIDIIGPLGKGFEILNDKNYKFILIGGGYGISPLYFLAEKIIKNFGGENNISVLIGAKKKNNIICEIEFKKLGCKVYISTEDGSKGYKGMVTELLNSQLSTLNSQFSIIYSCGPHLMLKEITKIAEKYKIKCYVSLEEILACGFGACLGCAVKTKNGYKFVCKDGPVFDAEEIIW